MLDDSERSIATLSGIFNPPPPLTSTSTSTSKLSRPGVRDSDKVRVRPGVLCTSTRPGVFDLDLALIVDVDGPEVDRSFISTSISTFEVPRPGVRDSDKVRVLGVLILMLVLELVRPRSSSSRLGLGVFDLDRALAADADGPGVDIVLVRVR